MKTEKAKPCLWKLGAWILPMMVFVCVFCQVKIEPGQKLVLRRQISELAKNLAGIPYRFGGIDIDGFDCSGLVSYVYDCFGIKVPRHAREQGQLSGSIKLKYAAKGDILVFKSRRTWHSAIYLGDGRFIHAPGTGRWVRIEQLNGYWLSRLRKVVSLWARVR